MSRFATYALFSLLGLAGSSDRVSASFRPVWNSDQIVTAAGSTSSNLEKPQLPREEDRPKIVDDVKWASHGGMGSVPSSSSNSQVSLPGALLETIPSVSTPYAILARLANQRFTLLPPIRSVFEPPRAS